MRLSNGRTGASDRCKRRTRGKLAVEGPFSGRAESGGDQNLFAARMLFVGEEKSVACPSVGSLQYAGGELDDGEGAPGALNPPRPDRVSGAKDVTVAVNERDVDRELHEERVDAVAGRKNEGGVWRQARASEEAAVTGYAVERGFDVPGDGLLMAGVAKNPGAVRCGEDGVQEPQDSLDCRVIRWRSMPSNGRPAERGRAWMAPGNRNWR